MLTEARITWRTGEERRGEEMASRGRWSEDGRVTSAGYDASERSHWLRWATNEETEERRKLRGRGKRREEEAERVNKRREDNRKEIALISIKIKMSDEAASRAMDYGVRLSCLCVILTAFDANGHQFLIVRFEELLIFWQSLVCLDFFHFYLSIRSFLTSVDDFSSPQPSWRTLIVCR